MRRAERPILFDAPAGFDDPLEMLLGCHRRIEKQLETLKRLCTHLQERGVDAEASTAAQAVLRYFQSAAPNHHQDEELDLFPLLQARIADASEQERFRTLRERLATEHRGFEGAWSRLRKPLEGIGEGLMRTLPAQEVEEFAAAYARHILAEESDLPQWFERWLDEADRRTLGRSMAARRTPPGRA